MPGFWEPVMLATQNFVHAIMLKTGQVMLFSYGFKNGQNWNTNIYLWTPGQPFPGPNAPPNLSLTNPTTNLLCAGHCQTGDGRVLFAGGHWDPVSGPNGTPPKDLNVFNAANLSAPWAPRAAMLKTRWYPTCTTLPSGKILITYGFLEKVNNNFLDVDEFEVFDPAVSPPPFPTQATQVFGNSQQYQFESYPFQFVVPSGNVFFAGPKRSNAPLPPRQLNATNSNPALWSWDSITSDFPAGFTNNAGGSACMFDAVRGKILTAGGVNLGAVETTPAHAACAIYDPSTKAWSATHSMHFPRRNHNLVCLPDESSLAVGGNLIGEHTQTGKPYPQPVMEAEIFKPWLGTNGQWERTFVTMTDPRYYHSTAILLRDARVLTAGGEIDNGDIDPPIPYTVNSAQIFRPPYLDNDANRPSIASSPATIGYGQEFGITLASPFLIGKVTMTRLGAVTHGFDQDQRCVKLSHSGGGSTPTTSITATAPANASIAPPGDYFLWVLSNTGVPCQLAAIVRIG